MSAIRPLEPGDLPEIAALFELVFGSGVREARPERIRYLESTLLEQPWTDPEIPSLVQLDAGGAIIGFIGSNVRRFRLGDRTLRAGCCAHFMSDPDAGARTLAALLLRRYLAGPQDLTFTDTGNDTVQAMWSRLGGAISHVRCLTWRKVLRPGSFAAGLVGDRARRSRWRGALRPAGLALDAVAARPLARVVGAPDPGLVLEPLGPEGLVRQVAEAAGSLGLRPDLDEPFARWLLAEIPRSGGGELRARLVRDERRPLGWFVYLLKADGARVLQVCAPGGDPGPVLDALLHDAEQGGAAVVRGRIEPALLPAITDRRCFLRYAGGALFHARDPEVLVALESSDALVTRLEGEW